MHKPIDTTRIDISAAGVIARLVGKAESNLNTTEKALESTAISLREAVDSTPKEHEPVSCLLLAYWYAQIDIAVADNEDAKHTLAALKLYELNNLNTGE